MDSYQAQNLPSLEEATAGPNESIGKSFDEADCDGEAAALQAGASVNIPYAYKITLANSVPFTDSLQYS